MFLQTRHTATAASRRRPSTPGSFHPALSTPPLNSFETHARLNARGLFVTVCNEDSLLSDHKMVCSRVAGGGKLEESLSRRANMHKTKQVQTLHLYQHLARQHCSYQI